MTLPLPLEGGGPLKLLAGYLGSEQATQNRKRKKKKDLQLFPDHFIVDVRPHCLLAGHLDTSVLWSGKDSCFSVGRMGSSRVPAAVLTLIRKCLHVAL